MLDLNDIQRKLDFLRATVDFNKNLEVFNDANGNADLFDVVGHRYQLGPRLGESDLAAVERRHSMALPEDYRAFLLQVGDGGAGPYYGLYPLARGIERAVEDALARPFPFTTPYVRPESAGEAAVESFLKDVNRAEHVQGALPLADFGCGIDALLVVTGAARGTLWLDDRHSDNGVWPLALVDGKVDCLHAFDVAYEGGDPGALQRCDFVTWYNDWLDERIDIHARYARGEWKAPWSEARRSVKSP